MKIYVPAALFVLAALSVVCLPATPAPSPTPVEQAETQAAATITAGQTVSAAVEQAVMLTLTADVPTRTKTPPPTPTSSAFDVDIPADFKWVDAGLEISAGQTVIITATGIVNTWGGKDISYSDAEGQPTYICGDVGCAMQGMNYGTLIGRLGAEKPFRVGVHLEFIPPIGGKLYLTVNDWEYSDNLGSFSVTITVK